MGASRRILVVDGSTAQLESVVELLERAGYAVSDASPAIEKLQVRLREAQKRLEELSVTDPVTGLKNRRSFDERLREEFRRAQRYGDFLSLIVIGLDRFDEVNDRFGQPAGDAVLREAASLIRGSMRDTDICSRYRGEDFAVILPRTHLSGALVVAERIWSALGAKKHVVPPTSASPSACDAVPRTVSITASVGIAFHPSRDISSGEQLVEFAEQALSQGRRAGANTICLYQAAGFRRQAAKG